MGTSRVAGAPRLRRAVAVCAVLVAVADPLQDAERITLSILTASPAAHLAGWSSPGAACETDVLRLARVFHELGLPLPTRITLELYPSADLLAHGITEQAGFAPDLASVVGRFAAGIAIDETLLMLEPESRRGPRAWLRLLAHEMAHLSQIELGGGVPVYRLAFVLADHLIERRGLGAVVAYFRNCTTVRGRRTLFEQSFGQRLEDFEREMVQALRPPAP